MTPKLTKRVLRNVREAAYYLSVLIQDLELNDPSIDDREDTKNGIERIMVSLSWARDRVNDDIREKKKAADVVALDPNRV